MRAQIKDIALINEELQALCDPDGRMSEAGYYLATLEASLQHISDIDVNTGELLEGLEQLSSSDEEDGDGDSHVERRYSQRSKSPSSYQDDDDDDSFPPEDSLSDRDARNDSVSDFLNDLSCGEEVDADGSDNTNSVSSAVDVSAL